MHHPISLDHRSQALNFRQEWGFQGFVVSDYGAIEDIWSATEHHYVNTAEQASALAVAAGCDQVAISIYFLKLGVDHIDNLKTIRTEEEMIISPWSKLFLMVSG